MSKLKVLICDDEESIRESLKLILSDHYDLIATESGEQCLECLKNSKDIGIVLIDIKMPKVNGLETLRQIKEARPDVKVVMVTGYKSVETAQEAIRLGADGYIVKPFKSEEILETIRKQS
ncbi:MAG: response regulator [Candidatus Omnitrophota bacterium]